MEGEKEVLNEFLFEMIEIVRKYREFNGHVLHRRFSRMGVLLLASPFRFLLERRFL